jgi:hypothetical protein
VEQVLAGAKATQAFKPTTDLFKFKPNTQPEFARLGGKDIANFGQ